LQYLGGLLSHEASKLCSDGPRYRGAEIDEKVKAFLSRPIEGDWPYLRIDAPYVKVRESGRIVSVAR
jgi:putative transposase